MQYTEWEPPVANAVVSKHMSVQLNFSSSWYSRSDLTRQSGTFSLDSMRSFTNRIREPYTSKKSCRSLRPRDRIRVGIHCNGLIKSTAFDHGPAKPVSLMAQGNEENIKPVSFMNSVPKGRALWTKGSATEPVRVPKVTESMLLSQN